MALLLGDPLLLRRASRLRRPAFFRHRKRVFDKPHQSLIGRLPILGLTSPVAGHHSNHSVRVEAGRQLRSEPLALVLGHGNRTGQIPQQLDARRRRVDVLAAGPARARRLVLKLRSRDRHAGRHSQRRRANHSRLRVEPQTPSRDDRPACNRARPGSSNTRYSRLQRFSAPDSFAVCNSSRDSCDSPPARPTPR